ncbi:MAG: prolyl oligopeptidase family serine peptidase [Pseudomonadota bacterium]
MKSFSLFLVVAVIAALTACASAQPRNDDGMTGVSLHAITADGMTRPFLVHEPEGYEPDAPLVILLHGGGGSMQKVLRQPHGEEWRKLSTQEGFLLVAPNGINARTGKPDGQRQSWNDHRENPDDSRADDVSFILSLIDWAAEKYGIDRARVYLSGASNGGMMTYRLLAEQPERFAGGAAFIANLPESTPDVLREGTPVPILIVNGTDDPLMLWEGGVVGQKAKRDRVLSTHDSVEWWKDRNDAPEDRTEIAALPDPAKDGCKLTVEKYGHTVWLVTMQGGGHAPPTLIDRRFRGQRAYERMAGNSCHDISGAAYAWGFFNQ